MAGAVSRRAASSADVPAHCLPASRKPADNRPRRRAPDRGPFGQIRRSRLSCPRKPRRIAVRPVTRRGIRSPTRLAAPADSTTSAARPSHGAPRGLLPRRCDRQLRLYALSRPCGARRGRADARQPMKPHRMRMTHDLVVAYGLDKHMEVLVRGRASQAALTVPRGQRGRRRIR